MDTFENFAMTRGPALLRLAVMLTGNRHDAEDLLQSAFVSVLRHWERVRAAGQPHAYVRRIVVNEHLSRRRRRRVREIFPATTPVDAVAPDSSQAVASRDAAWQLLATLPPQQRAVLALRYYEDLSDALIAELLGCSGATVRSNASRALATLRQALPSLDPEALP